MIQSMTCAQPPMDYDYHVAHIYISLWIACHSLHCVTYQITVDTSTHKNRVAQYVNKGGGGGGWVTRGGEREKGNLDQPAVPVGYLRIQWVIIMQAYQGQSYSV